MLVVVPCWPFFIHVYFPSTTSKLKLFTFILKSRHSSFGRQDLHAADHPALTCHVRLFTQIIFFFYKIYLLVFCRNHIRTPSAELSAKHVSEQLLRNVTGKARLLRCTFWTAALFGFYYLHKTPSKEQTTSRSAFIYLNE